MNSKNSKLSLKEVYTEENTYPDSIYNKFSGKKE